MGSQKQVRRVQCTHVHLKIGTHEQSSRLKESLETAMGKGGTSAVRAVAGVRSFGEVGTKSQETAGLLVIIAPRMTWSMIVQARSCKPWPKALPAPSLIGAGASSTLRGALQCCSLSL